MKLLVITSYFYPKVGGVEEHTFNLYKGLAKKGYEISVITTKHNSTVSKYEAREGLKIHRLPYQFKISNTPISLKWAKAIKKIIKKEKPDVIMAHSPVPFMSDLAIFTNKNIPLILKYHSGSMKKERSVFSNLLILIYEKFILKKLLNKVDYLICTSDFVRDKFLAEFKFKSTTITPGVDTKIFKPAKIANHQSKSILFVGRIDKASKWKGIKNLIDAFWLISAKYPAVKLAIVGDGDDLDNQKESVQKLGLKDRVDFLGQLKGERLVKQYQKASLLVLPSLSEAESFGIVLIEAMACKKPVVGSEIGGIPYVIDHGKDGLLAPPGNPTALAEAIVKILKNPQMAKKMGENGYQKVLKHYSWEKKVAATQEIIKTICEAPRPGGRGFFTSFYKFI